MTLKKVQKLEIIWVIIGILFNTISYWQLQTGEPALSATDPLIGNVFMAICGLVVLLGYKDFKKTYKYIMPFLTMSLAFNGWWLHIYAFIQNVLVPDYANFESWIAVVVINTFGVVVMALGSFMAFDK